MDAIPSLELASAEIPQEKNREEAMGYLWNSESRRAKEARYRGAIETTLFYLGIDGDVSLHDMVVRLGAVRQRPICVQAHPHVPMPFTGMTIIAPTYDMICYRTTLSATHINQVVCHEIVHLLQGHNREVAPPSTVRCLSIDDLGQRRVYGCGTYNCEEEFEAEYSATYLASKLEPARHWSCEQLASDDAALAPLHRYLRSFAPNAYLDGNMAGHARYAEPSHFTLTRMLAEITDARLLCYSTTASLVDSSFMLDGVDINVACHATFMAVAQWEAMLLHTQHRDHFFPIIPAELSTAPYQSLEYYRLLAAAVERVTTSCSHSLALNHSYV